MPLNTPGHWKVRAQEARVLAEALKAHPEAFAAMLKIADEYERLADRAAPSASRAHRRRYHRQSDGRAGALRNY